MENDLNLDFDTLMSTNHYDLPTREAILTIYHQESRFYNNIGLTGFNHDTSIDYKDYIHVKYNIPMVLLDSVDDIFDIFLDEDGHNPLIVSSHVKRDEKYMTYYEYLRIPLSMIPEEEIFIASLSGSFELLKRRVTDDFIQWHKAAYGTHPFTTLSN